MRNGGSFRPGGVEPGVPSPGRSPASLALLDRNRDALSRTARRVSLCDADSEDAVQRATVILLTKEAPSQPRQLIPWLHVVTKREALAIRRERERLLGAEICDSLPERSPCPPERAECRERLQLVVQLKPDEQRALILRGCGYSYREICELTGWTHTKVNRCLAEGRARLRALSRDA